MKKKEKPNNPQQTLLDDNDTVTVFFLSPSNPPKHSHKM